MKLEWAKLRCSTSANMLQQFTVKYLKHQFDKAIAPSCKFFLSLIPDPTPPMSYELASTRTCAVLFRNR